jgi:hypothetical protein
VYSLTPLGISVDHGVYKRSSCLPADEVPADGKEHPVAGDPFMQSLSVRLPDRDHAEIVQRSGGKVTWRGIYTVSKDRKTMTLKYEDNRAMNLVSGTILFAREGGIVAGAHALSGVWRPEKLVELSASGLGMTWRDTDAGLSMTATDGRSYDIKFDWSDYPLVGYLPGASVTVGRANENHLQVNRKQNGILVEFSWGTVSDDGRSMKLIQLDEQCQSKVEWTLQKQGS